MTTRQHPRTHRYAEIEAIDSSTLDELIRRRLRYTLEYARKHSEYWADRFDEVGIVPERVEEPADLLALDPIDNETFVARQPPATDDFEWPIFHEGMSHRAHCTRGRVERKSGSSSTRTTSSSENRATKSASEERRCT